MLALSSALLAVALAVPGAQAFFRMPCSQPVVTMRADSIVNPGLVSGHVHQVLGGNGFDFNQSYADARASTCSTCMAREDLSNYWTPVPYFHTKDNKFIKVPQIGGALIYYLQRRGHDGEKIVAFPDGFRMLAGSPALRSYNASSLEQRAISFTCLDYSGSGLGGETKEMPPHYCPNGLRTQVFFPSCWDGKNLDSADHKGHVAYPSNMDSGSCPDTHPVRLVSLFYEVTFDTAKFKDQWWVPSGAKQPIVLSNGDPTGYGHHGDFLNGWDKAALQKAIDGCNQESGVIEDCKNVLSLRTNDEMNNCIMAPRVNEVITGTVDKLPGCNPVTNGPGNAAFVTSCASSGAAAANLIIPAGEATYLNRNIPGWKPVGCARDDGAQRLLPKKFTNGKMTTKACTDYCGANSFKYAGLEWGEECWCGNTLDQSKVGQYVCNQPCQGDDSEFCGNGQRLSVYAAGSYTPPSSSTPVTVPTSSTTVKVTTTTPTPTKTQSSTTTKPTSTSSPAKPTTAAVPNFTALGCFVDSKASRTLSGTSLYSGEPMTPAVCAARCAKAGFKFAGVEYSKECFCGNGLTKQTKVAETECSTACTGDSRARCGAADRILIYQSKTTSTAQPTKPALSKAPTGFTSLGCFTDSKQSRTLPDAGMYTGKPMTAAVCTSYCSTKGFKFSGLEYGTECWCSNSIHNRKSVATTECAMTCKGDSKSTCGDADRIQIFQKNTAKREHNARRLSSTH
ncbi:WSC-domain-containing protein [Auriculariales sp. MPI-PUGE-AT-0066]|nr:WSC-domain-containing protein [Auriculariales sp. MPI-PUGE-AT-0066]